MLRLISLVLFLCYVAESVAQKVPVKFGNVPLEDLKMNSYANDSSAAAVVLVDYGESTIEYNQITGFELFFERTRRIKVLKKEGLQWADFTILLYKDSDQDEKVSNLKGVTYNLENGKIAESKLKSDAIFKEKRDQNIDLVKVTFPNVKEGSVIELTYKVKSDFFFNFQDWEFQTSIPVVWSEYRATIPEYFNYNKYTQGYLAMAINEQSSKPGSITLTEFNRTGGDRTTAVQSSAQAEKIDFKLNTFRWVVQNAPAFKAESFMTTQEDYISKINFELEFIKMPDGPITTFMGSWEDINTKYADNADFGGEVSGNGFLKKIVEDITAGATTPEQKTNAIVAYVKQNIAWDGRNRKFTEKPLRKVLDDRKGNSAEVNLLLASMLDKAGLEVYPVLISTRDHGFLRDFIPVSSQFNYVICLVRWETKQLLLDATESLLPTGFLPERCLNGKGFLVSNKGFEWVKLEAPAKTRSVVSADLVLAQNGELKGSIQFEYFGYRALEKRKSYLSQGEPEYLKALTDKHSWELKKSEFQNAKDIQQGFKEIHEVLIPEHVTTAGDLMYISPILIYQQTENPFKLEKREYPVDFGTPFDRLYLAKLVLPEGYTVEELPQSKVLSLPGNAARYITNVNLAGNVLTYMGSLSINKSIFTSEEYPNLREFYNLMVAKQTEQIVLKRK